MDLMAMDYCLSATDKDAILEHLKQVEMEHAVCSACGSEVETSFMRKLHEASILSAMCVPCFLNNYGDSSIEERDIDRLVLLGEKKGWYFNI